MNAIVMGVRLISASNNLSKQQLNAFYHCNFIRQYIQPYIPAQMDKILTRHGVYNPVDIHCENVEDEPRFDWNTAHHKGELHFPLWNQRSSALEADTIYHEYTHAITHALCNHQE